MARQSKKVEVFKDAPETLNEHPFYGFQLDEDQKYFRDCIWNKDKLLILCDAKAGSGKTTMAFATANNITRAPFEVMKIASEADREYIGLNNGLLDQACIALGKKNHLLLLDCESDEYRVIPKPAEMPDFELGIFFSGLTRSLISSDYNLRVTECKTAAPQYKNTFKVYFCKSDDGARFV